MSNRDRHHMATPRTEEDDSTPAVYVDVPDMYDPENSSWRNLETFTGDTAENDALAYAKKVLGADSQGRIGVVSGAVSFDTKLAEADAFDARAEAAKVPPACTHAEIDWSPVATACNSNGTAEVWQRGKCKGCQKKMILHYTPGAPKES